MASRITGNFFNIYLKQQKYQCTALLAFCGGDQHMAIVHYTVESLYVPHEYFFIKIKLQIEEVDL